MFWVCVYFNTISVVGQLLSSIQWTVVLSFTSTHNESRIIAIIDTCAALSKIYHPMKERVWLSPPHMGGAERGYVKEAFDTNWIAPVGPHVEKFEQMLADYNGVGHAAALSSGTAAIHLALIILGVQPGDVVICSSFTFTASANPICYLGARPVFVDSETETWNMDPELLKKAIETSIKKYKKPKAIILSPSLRDVSTTR